MCAGVWEEADVLTSDLQDSCSQQWHLLKPKDDLPKKKKLNY